MNADNQDRFRQLPSLTELLSVPTTALWLEQHPRSLVVSCLRQAVNEARHQIRTPPQDNPPGDPIPVDWILATAAALLAKAIEPNIREAINATGIILHTGLGRAVYPEKIVDAMIDGLKGCVTLAVDRQTGDRAERDELIEPLLIELTGAEAATVVNNNAAATLLVLAALAAEREVVVSRGQLIEIGGSFRLPDVMSQSRVKLVEVGTTNRTHLRDYQRAITDNTAALMKVHPSNYRVLGFTSEVGTAELAELAHQKGICLIDDLGAGALVDLARFGLPHEPTVQESLEAGADVVLFSADKLIGAAQAGIIVGRKNLIDRIRKHPLMRALRTDKTCLMVLERTLALFRSPDTLAQAHPTYRMLAQSMDVLKDRAGRLQSAILAEIPHADAAIQESLAYLGSGSLPTQALDSLIVTVSLPGLGAAELARRLRMDPACVFGRIQQDALCLDVRTITDNQLPSIAAALARAQS
jgi:L-seryl-tRNA(Ser) seleniumtransferase